MAIASLTLKPLFRLLPFLFVAALAVGCSSSEDVPPSDVFSTTPWRGNESLSYVLKNDDGKELGRGTLAVEVSGSTTKLSQSFTSDSGTDESSVVVNSSDLKPQSGTRKIDSKDDDNDETVEVTYTEAGATIKQGDKQSGISVPEHSYDNDTSLFLWRTIAFVEDYKGAYITIITNRRTRQDVTLVMKGKEQVTVPAGTYTAWKLEIQGANAKQHAWFADTPAKTLLKYDNDRNVIFELERLP